MSPLCELCKTGPATKFAKFEVSTYLLACGRCSRRETYHVPIDEYFRSQAERDDWNEHLRYRTGFLQFKAAVQRYLEAGGDAGETR
jgi:hypothetical protein